MKHIYEDLVADEFELDNIATIMLENDMNEDDMNEVFSFINTKSGYRWKVKKEALALAADNGDFYEGEKIYEQTKRASVDDAINIAEILHENDVWHDDIEHILDYVHMSNKTATKFASEYDF